MRIRDDASMATVYPPGRGDPITVTNQRGKPMNATTLFESRRLLVLATAAALLGGCSKAQTLAAPQAPQVSVVTVHRTSVPVTIELPGRTNPYFVAQVRARVDGIVLKRDYKEGTDVKAGQRLYKIDPAPYIAALDSAKATLQKSQANLVAMKSQAERYKELVTNNAVSKQDYDNAVSSQGQAEADVASGKAMIDTAQINLGYTAVVSPISGRAGISQVTEGAYVQASAATLMTTVQQINPIYVDLTQSSVQGLDLRRAVATGQLKLNGPNQVKVTLLLEDGSEYDQTGSLQVTDVTVDPTTGTVTVRTVFPNPTSVLLPGMFVRARIEEGVSENAFLVPQAGVTHDPKGQATALVVEPDNKAQLRTLQLRGTRGDQWIVEGGLKDGDRVIVGGLQRIQPGATVVATEAPAAPPNPVVAAVSTPGGSASANAGSVTKVAARSRVVADASPVPQRPASAATK
jgi:membrane fusion protein (multidrug efflux system)